MSGVGNRLVRAALFRVNGLGPEWVEIDSAADADTCEQLSDLLQCKMFECVQLVGEVYLVVDEENFLKQRPVNINYRQYSGSLVRGDVLVIADGKDGVLRDLTEDELSGSCSSIVQL